MVFPQFFKNFKILKNHHLLIKVGYNQKQFKNYKIIGNNRLFSSINHQPNNLNFTSPLKNKKQIDNYDYDYDLLAHPTEYLIHPPSNKKHIDHDDYDLLAYPTEHLIHPSSNKKQIDNES